MSDTASLPGVSRLILVASEKYPRYSEADVIALNDGSLLLAVGRKDGASDFAAGTLIGMFSRDGGVSWDEQPHVIRAPHGDVVDLMSVSFCRSPRGIHLFYLGRGKDAKGDTQVYQILSADEGKTWGEPARVNLRPGYYVVNNARVIRTGKNRMLVPAAYVQRIDKDYDGQSILVLHSDDDGVSWRESNVLSLEGKPLMEPGVAECAEGSIYMTIRTTTGVLYEARSRDGGATWTDMGPTKLPSPAAPSTVVRAPESDELWMLWCNNAKAKWRQRSPQVFARSNDHGKTWSEPRVIEHDPKHGYGYISFTRVGSQALLTYYDWPDNGQAGFHMTSLRQRTIPLAWFRSEPTPPVFTKRREPVLAATERSEGKAVSASSGLLIDKDRWRLWYTGGGDLCRAESRDRGLTWVKRGVVLENAYGACVQREGGVIILFALRADGIFRFVSSDAGETFTPQPQEPVLQARDGFDLVRNRNGALELFVTMPSPNATIGPLRVVGRSTPGVDGVTFEPPEVVIAPDPHIGDGPRTSFHGALVLRYRDFYLALLETSDVVTGAIQPEWAWSHDGQSWTRTRVPCIPLGDEGSFDCRIVARGALTMADDEIIWLYTGSDGHDDMGNRKVEIPSSIGRAVLAKADLDAWIDTLPQP